MFSNYFELEDGMRLFYKVYGSTAGDEINLEQPTLIFLHGGPGVVDHSLYEGFWSKFSKDEITTPAFQVIFIDHRGCGRSFIGDKDYGPTEKWNLAQWGKDVYDFFSGIGINKPVIAGVSFGGVVAISCATQYPDKISGLILCDTDAKFDLDEVIKAFEKNVRSARGTPEDIALVCETARRMFLNTTPENYNSYVRVCMPYCSIAPYSAEAINNCVKNEAAAFHYNRTELTTFDFLPDLPRVTCPALVMSGDKSPVHTEVSARKTALALPEHSTTLIIFENTGSPVYANNDKAVTDAINLLLNHSISYKAAKDYEEANRTTFSRFGCK